MATLFMPFYRKAIDALGLGAHWEVLALNPQLALEVLEDIFRSQPRTHWLGLLTEAGVPCAPVGDRTTWFAGEAVRDAGLRLEFDDPIRGRLAMPGPPVRLSATPASVRSLPVPGALPAWAPPPPLAAGPGASRPLEGVRVLDMGSVIAGALAGAVLANLGSLRCTLAFSTSFRCWDRSRSSRGSGGGGGGGGSRSSSGSSGRRGLSWRLWRRLWRKVSICSFVELGFPR
jgi:uncharacterized membrane protein YgcG